MESLISWKCEHGEYSIRKNKMITIEEISSLDGFWQMRDKWDYLLKESGMDNIFLSFDWMLTWWRYFSKGNSLFILKIIDDGQLIGIAPLMIHKHVLFGLPVKTIFFMGTVISDRMDFILTGPKKKESILEVLGYIMKNASRWDIVDLQEMADITGNSQILRECIKALNFSAVFGTDTKSFYISFRDVDKRNFSKSFFSRNIRMRLRAASNRAKRDMASEFEFKRFLNPDNNGVSLEDLLAEMERIEKASWKGKGCVGVFLNPRTRIFHREIIKNYFKKGMIDISFLSINGRNIAYQYNYFCNARLYGYSTAYDSRYSRLSPGLVLQIYILENSCQSMIEEVDCLRGEEEWKSRLTSDYKIHARTRIFNKTARSEFLFILQSLIFPHLKKAKEHILRLKQVL
jgi:CelD/BcsL family acetyltransferase involved in cellulose biosynthesis